MLGLVLGPVLGVTAVAHAAPLKPKSSKARAHFDKAVELYKAEDFDAAAAEANAGLAIEGHESLLFILAQAERQRGNCVEAVEIFTKFIEMTQSDDMRQNALTAKALCAEELAEIARKAEEERKAAERAAAEAAQQANPSPSVTPPPKVERPWYRDPLGGVLVGVGGAGLVAGTAVLVTGVVLDPGAAEDYGQFEERLRLQRKLLIAGGITAGVGAVLGAGGAVRWALLAKKNKDRAPAAAHIELRPWLDRRRAGVVLRARF